MHAAAMIERTKTALAAGAGASVMLIASRIAGMAAAFLFTLVLARSLSPADVGAVLAVMSGAFLASLFVTLNIESGSIRFVVAAQQQNHDDVARGFLSFGRLIILGASPFVVAGFLAILFLWDGQAASQHRGLVFLAAASIPIMGWLRFSGSIATAVGVPLQGSAPRTCVQPAAMLAIFSVIVMSSGMGTPTSAGASFLIAFIVAALVQFLLLRDRIRFGEGRTRNFSEKRDWLVNGFYLSPLILLQENLQYAAILAASLCLGASDVAIYAIAFRVTAIIRFAVLAVNIAVSSKISRAMASGDHALRDAILKNAAPLRVFPALAATALVILFAGPILTIFGEAYARGATALVWFALIPLSAAMLGPNQMLLNIAGHRRSASAVSLAALIVLVSATAYSGQAFGVAGAAAATAIAYSLWELSLFFLARAKLGVNASVFVSIR